MPGVFRIHIRPTGGRNDRKYSFDYCLRESVLGLGWGLDGRQRPGVTWKQYEKEATRIHGSRHLASVRMLHRDVAPGDLLWTRDPSGEYFLARTDDRWHYRDSPEARDADVLNVVRCSIKRVLDPLDVPGKVVASFRPQKSLQPIRDSTAVAYSQLLWNQLTDSIDFVLTRLQRPDFFSLLGSEDAENLLYIFLQTHGWLVVPESRKADTMGYEYVLIERDTHRRAIAQVKTGDEPLRPSEWSKPNLKVFLFQARGIYPGPPAHNVVCLPPEDLQSFAQRNEDLMPGPIRRWLHVFSTWPSA